MRTEIRVEPRGKLEKPNIERSGFPFNNRPKRGPGLILTVLKISDFNLGQLGLKNIFLINSMFIIHCENC